MRQVLNAKNAQPKEVAEEDVPALIESMMQEKIKASKVKPAPAYMPEVGEECDIEFAHHIVKNATITYQGNGVGAYINPRNSKEYTMSHLNTKFTAIQSERDKVIEAARKVAHQGGADSFTVEAGRMMLIEELYDLGCLKLPEQG